MRLATPKKKLRQSASLLINVWRPLKKKELTFHVRGSDSWMTRLTRVNDYFLGKRA